MTVETLIKRLEKLPKNATIKIFCSNDNYSGDYITFNKDNLFTDSKGNIYFDGR